ncbi:MAG: hypothetical protein ACLPIX_06035 [Rhodomicrobium sp.]
MTALVLKIALILVVVAVLGALGGLLLRRRKSVSEIAGDAIAVSNRGFVYSQLKAEGPDGSRFILTDVSGSTLVRALAVELKHQYGGPLASASVIVLDLVSDEGYGRRLDPDLTLIQEGVRDGDELQFSLQSTAAGGPGNRLSTEEMYSQHAVRQGLSSTEGSVSESQIVGEAHYYDDSWGGGQNEEKAREIAMEKASQALEREVKKRFAVSHDRVAQVTMTDLVDCSVFATPTVQRSN